MLKIACFKRTLEQSPDPPPCPLLPSLFLTLTPVLPLSPLYNDRSQQSNFLKNPKPSRETDLNPQLLKSPTQRSSPNTVCPNEENLKTVCDALEPGMPLRGSSMPIGKSPNKIFVEPDLSGNVLWRRITEMSAIGSNTPRWR